MKKEFLEAGKIICPHGVRGEVKVMPLCDSAELLAEFERLFMRVGREYVEIPVERSRAFKDRAIIKLKGTDSPEEAEKLRNSLLFMHRDDLILDEETYFIQDLVNLEVRDADTGFVYGKIADVFQTGANDVYVVQGEDREYLVPAIGQVVLSTDIDNELMLIRPLEGLFD
ncbi:MAG: ribosome maturation factor RimM [Ruminococcus sp.]|nr:ribosome maturation factor RimM [Ruminococcus sp.]